MTDAILNRSPLAQMEEERREHVMKMKKMEAEMEQVFEMKVKEKKQKLKDSEAEVQLCFYTSGITDLFESVIHTSKMRNCHHVGDPGITSE